MRDATLEIHGMHSDGCAARVKTLLEREPGRVRRRRRSPKVVPGCATTTCRRGERPLQPVEIAGFEVKGRS